MRFFIVFIALIISVSIFGNSQTPFAFIKNSVPPAPLAAENFKCWLVSNDVNSSGLCGPVSTTVSPTVNGSPYPYGFSYYCPTAPTTQAWNTGSTAQVCNLFSSSNDNLPLNSGGPLYKQSGSPDLIIEKDVTGLYTSNWNGSNCTNTWYSPPCSTYTNASIASISPTSAITATGAGTAVTINGNNFRAGSTVSIGGSTCTSPTVYKTKINCTTSAHAQGLSNVVVTSPSGGGGNVTLTNGYTYNVANVAVSNQCGSGLAEDSSYLNNIAPISEYGKSFTINEDILGGGGHYYNCVYSKRIYCPSIPAVTSRAVGYTSYILSGGSWAYKVLSPAGTLHYSKTTGSQVIQFNADTGVLKDYDSVTYGTCTIVP